MFTYTSTLKPGVESMTSRREGGEVDRTLVVGKKTKLVP